MPPKNNKRHLSRMAIASTLVLSHLPAFALGFGPASGNPVLGRPLRVEIELIGTERDAFGANCFKLMRPQAPVDDYALKGAQIALERSEGRSFVVVTHPSVQYPIVEFSLHATCGTSNLARDYILLASPEPQSKPGNSVAVVAPTVAPPAHAPLPKPEAQATETATPPFVAGSVTTTLEKLARQNYPNQPKAREKYKRMMRAANPSFFPAGVDHDSHPIPANDALKMPAGLPERRHGPYRSPGTETKPAPAATPPKPETKAPPKPAVAAANDVLKIGAPTGTPQPAEVVEAELVRIENIHAELNQTQQQIASKLDSAESAFIELKNHLLRMENRVRELEAEREQEAQRRKVTDVIQLVFAVLLGGAAGAGLLRFLPPYLERRRKPTTDKISVSPSVSAPARPQIVSVFSALHQEAPVKAEVANTAPPPPPAPTPVAATPPAYDFDFVSWLPENETAVTASASGEDQPLPPPKPR